MAAFRQATEGEVPWHWSDPSGQDIDAMVAKCRELGLPGDRQKIREAMVATFNQSLLEA